MVNSINESLYAQNTKSREKQPSSRSVEGKKDRMDGNVVFKNQNGTGDSISNEPESFINLDIASANMEAAKVSVSDEKEADRLLLQTAELMKENPEAADAAQANVPPYIVLSLFELK